MANGRPFKSGFTILDITVVLIVLAILATVLMPQLAEPQGDSVSATAEFNLGLLRSAIRSYQADHQGKSPALDQGSLSGLLPEARGPGGIAYLEEVPMNPFTEQRAIRATDKTSVTESIVATDGQAGWIYNPSTGQIWLDSKPGFDL